MLVVLSPLYVQAFGINYSSCELAMGTALSALGWDYLS